MCRYNEVVVGKRKVVDLNGVRCLGVVWKSEVRFRRSWREIWFK